jgi:molybdopterin/thiamine biosynthesis adenylyltransferase
MYDYDLAVARNLGWVTAAEQQRLRAARVAVAGLGGVGGSHLLTLARLGVGRFRIADFDRFELQNFNRQAGATIATLGRPKLEVLRQMALDVNPEAEVEGLAEGVQPGNVETFLDGVDVCVDGIDFFALAARRLLFDVCRRRGIPALTAAPLGMGVALLYFAPGAMSFEDYFRLDGQPEVEQYARFIAGLSPAMLQRGYLALPQAVDFAERRGPSTAMACELCAGVIGTAVLKLLLRRGRLRPAPWALQFDAYAQRLRHTWRPWGNAHPLQRLLLRKIRPRLGVAPAP